MAEPINISGVLAVWFRCMPKFQETLVDQDVTVAEAIDLCAKIAHETAIETGVADSVILTTRDDGDD